MGLIREISPTLSVMPKVVPSEVVRFIKQQFPGDEHGRMTYNQAPAYATIVRLVEQIPEELLMISGDDYVGLVAGTEDPSSSSRFLRQPR
jgi:hypothetical protein